MVRLGIHYEPPTCTCFRDLLKRLFQYQAASEAGVLHPSASYAPPLQDILSPMLVPPVAMEKAKPVRVKVKKGARSKPEEPRILTPRATAEGTVLK